MEIDIEKLRSDLIDYYGSLAQFYPSAYLEVSRIENASYDEVVRIALSNGFDLSKYQITRKLY